jgi:membrane protease YdiL (CAAX protease family)
MREKREKNPPVSTEYNRKKTGKNISKGKVIELRPTMLVLATYILLLISKFIDLALLNRDNEYMSVIILQMMIFLLPGALWCMFNGEKYIKNIRISAPKFDTLPLILCSAFLMMSGAMLIGILFSGMDSLSNNFSLYDTFISKKDGSFSNALYLILAYAALPALCEEFIYRGILCHEYEKGGVLKAIVINSIFFSLLHFNISNLFVYLFCGAILSLVLYATRSFWGAVIAHFIYNIFGVFGQPYMATLYKFTKDSRLLLMIVGIVFFLSASIFCTEASRLYRKYLRSGLTSKHIRRSNNGTAYFRETFLDVAKDPFAIACVGIYIIAVIILHL